MKKIAVENALGHWKDSLRREGYEVVDLEAAQQSHVPDILCYVISGQDKDMMGIADKQADLPVINADGCTEAELLEQVRQRADMVLNSRG